MALATKKIHENTMNAGKMKMLRVDIWLNQKGAMENEHIRIIRDIENIDRVTVNQLSWYRYVQQNLTRLYDEEVLESMSKENTRQDLRQHVDESHKKKFSKLTLTQKVALIKIISREG